MPAPHHPPSPPASPPSGSSSAAGYSTSPPPPRSSAPSPAGPSACPSRRGHAPTASTATSSDTSTIPLPGPGPGFNRAYAMTTDLTQPVIIATMPGSAAAPCPLLIDGTHRLFKGHATGAAELPAYVLTEAETLAIRAPR